MNRIWILAAVPLVLMTWMFFGFWFLPSFTKTVSFLTCVAILVGAFLTGLYVLFVILTGWWRGAYQLKHGDILAATTFASLDVLIPTTLAVLLWLLIRILKGGNLLLF